MTHIPFDPDFDSRRSLHGALDGLHPKTSFVFGLISSFALISIVGFVWALVTLL